MDKQSLVVTEIERSAIHDGPGLRTVVFLQGCPLHCVWCCNPETQSVGPVLLHDRKKCVGCGACISACPHHAVSLLAGNAQVDRKSCVGCGACVEVCPHAANSISGKVISLTEILDTVCRDRHFYDATGGGLTLSGGEPLLQPQAIDLLRMAKERNLSTWVETTACVTTERLLLAAEFTDGFYVDYKHCDTEALLCTTGAKISVIEENLEFLIKAGAKITLRTPVIPGFNDDRSVLKRCFEASMRLGLQNHILLPYHGLGAGKYEKLGKDYGMGGVPSMQPEELEDAVALGELMGLHVRIGG